MSSISEITFIYTKHMQYLKKFEEIEDVQNESQKNQLKTKGNTLWVLKNPVYLMGKKGQNYDFLTEPWYPQDEKTCSRERQQEVASETWSQRIWI